MHKDEAYYNINVINCDLEIDINVIHCIMII